MNTTTEAHRLVYFNGRFVPEAEARVSIFDSALMFGDMVFEMTRTFQHQPFKLREHLERLYASMRVVEIDCGMMLEEMEAATHETIQANREAIPPEIDFQIMHNVSRGPLGFYHSVFPEGARPTVTINCWPLTRHLSGLAQFYRTGIHLFVARQRNVPSQYLDPKVKNRSRLHYQLANLEAAHVGPDAFAVLLDDQGRVTEGTGSNVFAVRSGVLLTPRDNVLRGVTRQTTLELAADLGLSAQECDLEPYDLATADELFLTSTPFCLLPAYRFNYQPIGDGTPGSVTWTLLAEWSNRVGVDVAAQAERYREMVEA
jgi:branched-chain amino acid aminotransferase